MTIIDNIPIGEKPIGITLPIKNTFSNKRKGSVNLEPFPFN